MAKRHRSRAAHLADSPLMVWPGHGRSIALLVPMTAESNHDVIDKHVEVGRTVADMPAGVIDRSRWVRYAVGQGQSEPHAAAPAD